MPPELDLKVLLLGLLLVGVSACAPAVSDVADPAPPAEAGEFVPSDATILDGGDVDSLREAVRQQLIWLERLPADAEVDYRIRSVSATTIAATLREFEHLLISEPSEEAISEWVSRRFEAVTFGDGEVLVTGYFEPVIEGSRHRTDEATVPVYRRPDDLVTVNLSDFSTRLPEERIAGRVVDGSLVPYFTRQEIQEEGALADRDLELAWVNDRVDLFFVEIQGSGAVAFPDGDEMRIGFAASNGRPYRSIGRLLIEEGAIPENQMSMQALRRYLADNPGEVSRILNHNESLVFFRELDTPPVGSLGVPVTPGRSVAVDHRIYPSGALAFLETHEPALSPDGSVTDGPALRRIVLLQDAGGAIRGPRRVDYFWGRGEDAALRAGLMRQRGRLVVLVPRTEE